MKETDWAYNQRMQEARHSLTTGGDNFGSRGWDIFFLWGKYNLVTPESKNWNKFVTEVKEMLGII